MRGYLDTLKVIVQNRLAQSLRQSAQDLIVGGIILFGSLLVVVGTALVDSVDASMSRSVIGSVAGHIQVYSAKSKDELTVMGSMAMESPDLTPSMTLRPCAGRCSQSPTSRLWSPWVFQRPP